MGDVAVNYRRVVERIGAAAARCRRDPASIRLVAVTKTVSVERIREAIDCGIRDIGENRLQEALPKQDALANLGLTWHFIGRLQTNKAKKVAQSFDFVHSIDREDLADKLNASCGEKRLKVLLEVKLGGETTKSGLDPGAVAAMVESVRSFRQLDLCGLMALPPYFEDPEDVRPCFRRLREQAEIYGLSELSMGMSHDFEVAVEEGATMLRIGSALFGARS